MTFGVGYAWLDAELDENLFGLRFPFDNGDGSGFKLGLTWRDLFNEHVGYTVGIEYFKYEYDMDVEGVSKSLDIEEELASITIGLFYVL
jgi:hypothetical protein